MVPDDHAQLLQETTVIRRGVPASGLDSCSPAVTRRSPTGSTRPGRRARRGGLYSTTPEAIVAKSALISAIEALEPARRPGETVVWGAPGSRRSAEPLERQFTQYDRQRYGAPTSPDRLITATRERFPRSGRVTRPRGPMGARPVADRRGPASRTARCQPATVERGRSARCGGARSGLHREDRQTLRDAARTDLESTREGGRGSRSVEYRQDRGAPGPDQRRERLRRRGERLPTSPLPRAA